MFVWSRLYNQNLTELLGVTLVGVFGDVLGKRLVVPVGCDQFRTGPGGGRLIRFGEADEIARRTRALPS